MWRCSCRRLLPLRVHVPYRRACLPQAGLVTLFAPVCIPCRTSLTHAAHIRPVCGALAAARRTVTTSNDTAEQDASEEKKEGMGDSNKDDEDNDASELPGGAESDDGTNYLPSLRAAAPPSAYDLPETTFLKCIEKEMMDEKLRLDREPNAPTPPMGWQMHHAEGTSLIYGRRLWQPTAMSAAEGNSNNDNKEETTTTMMAASQAGSTLEDKSNEDAAAKGPAASLWPYHGGGGLERHFIRVQLTCRDASLDPECDIRGEHFPFSFFVQRVRKDELAAEGAAALVAAAGEDGLGDEAYAARVQAALEQDELTFLQDSVEVRCDVVEGEVTVQNVLFHGSYTLPKGTSINSSSANVVEANGSAAASETVRVVYDDPFGSSYPGPNLDEAEEEVLDGIQSWLAERMIDDQFGEFVAQYSVWTEQAEYERWLKQLYDYVAA